MTRTRSASCADGDRHRASSVLTSPRKAHRRDLCQLFSALISKFPKAETGANFQKYTTLVVKDFESTVGDVPPVRVRQDLPGTVIARLNECYPGAFEKITREASGSAEEFVVNGTITEYNEGSRFARFMLGAYGGGSAKLVADVSLTDGTGRELARTEGRWVSSPVGGGLGALVGIEQLVLTAGGEIADRIAEKRGVKMAEKCSELEKAQRER